MERSLQCSGKSSVGMRVKKRTCVVMLGAGLERVIGVSFN